MLPFRWIHFIGGLLIAAPFAALAYWVILVQRDAALENLHFTSPGAMAVEPWIRWFVEHRYGSAATSVLTGAVSLAWYHSKVKSRQIERALSALERPRRRRRG